MVDREKVIRAVETCFDSWIDKHRYMGLDLHEVVQMKRDALELLKEREPIKPIKPRGSASWICGACKKAIGTSLIYSFCPWCGAEVKQDD